MKIDFMNQLSKKNKKTFYLIRFLIFSILLHFVITIIFFIYGFKKKALHCLSVFSKPSIDKENKDFLINKAERRKKIVQNLQKIIGKIKDERPAQLRAKKSNFGWILFDNEETNKITQTIIPTTLDGLVGESISNQVTENPIINVIDKKQQITDFNQTTKQNKIVHQEKNIPLSTDNNQTEKNNSNIQYNNENKPTKLTHMYAAHNFADNKNSEKINEITQAIIPKTLNKIINESPNNKITENSIINVIDEKQPIIDHNQTTKQNKTVHQEKNIPLIMKYNQTEANNKSTQYNNKNELTGSTHIRGAYSTIKKPKKNILTLTKGFIEKWKGEEGDDLIDRDGDPLKRPNFDELKYISYESKLSWCMQASWKQNFALLPAQEAQECNAIIEFSLDAQGILKKCTLLKSTGYEKVDKMIMKNMNFSSPFPPIPKHFNCTTYTTTRLINVEAENRSF